MKLRNNPSGVNNRRKRAKIRLLSNLDDIKIALKKHNAIPEEKQETSHMNSLVRIEREIVRIENEIGRLDLKIVPDETAHQRKNKIYRGVR